MLIREYERSVSFGIGMQVPHDNQLADHRTPFLRRQIIADTEHAQVVVPILQHFVRRLPGKHVHDMSRTKPLPRSVHGG